MEKAQEFLDQIRNPESGSGTPADAAAQHAGGRTEIGAYSIL
jgi:hypothetical protein